MLHKRLSLALSFLVISGSSSVATRYVSSQSSQQRKPISMTVLRGKHHIKNKPTSLEIAYFKAPQENERKLEDEIPKHVPLKIKIRKEKEKEFRDLKNERWARDFELEVTNTGDKPIYSLTLLAVTDVRAAKGFRIIAPLNYGRVELGDLRVKADPDDISIKSGESYIFKVHPGQLEAWDVVWRKENRPYPKKIQIVFQYLSFGDGTGYAGTDGLALPRQTNQQSSFGICPNQPLEDLTERNAKENAAHQQQRLDDDSVSLRFGLLTI
ncbi:MAG: hypothetical protein H7Z16_12100 [Pyrinomonadaceae bacterium]|nr:hypothetical protein [Pyrinomonadaceae bacterium]